MDKTSKKYWTILIYIALPLVSIIAFEQVRYNDFVWDDILCITDNPHVNGGITRESVFWAFSTPYAGNWLPVTFLSHMLDCELFGLNPLWHHLTNLLFHIVNTLLLFWVLKSMTGAVWRSAFIAAAFALHPLHVESVAWVTERKDLLSTLFGLLAIAAYVRYVRQPGIGRYLLVFLSFGLALMAKPMLVTLPFVLLLLDYWPLQRLQWKASLFDARCSSVASRATWIVSTPWRLIAEKIPLFILTVASAIVTFIAQQKAGAMEMLENLPINVRIANTAVSYIGYLSKLIYPSRLAILYPHLQDSLLAWQPIVSIVVLAAITISIIYLSQRQRKYLIVGWLWFLGTLVPVIGLIQVGVQGMADRYTYLPSIGFFIMVAWGLEDILNKSSYRRTALAIGTGAVLVALLICTKRQVRYWQNNLTLFGHTIAVTENNPTMLYNLGCQFQKIGKLDESITCFTEALRLKPEYALAHNNLGAVLKVQGKINDAVSHFQQALLIEPHHVHAHCNLANILSGQGKFDQAIEHYRQALQINPHLVQPLNNMAWILATHPDPQLRNPDQAIELAERAAKLKRYHSPTILNTLAAAYAAAGRFPEAIETAEKALDLAQSSEQKQLAEDIRNCLLLFKAGQPYIENGKQ